MWPSLSSVIVVIAVYNARAVGQSSGPFEGQAGADENGQYSSFSMYAFSPVGTTVTA